VMRENGVGSIAIVDERGKLVGFLQSGRIRPQRKAKPR